MEYEHGKRSLSAQTPQGEEVTFTERNAANKTIIWD